MDKKVLLGKRIKELRKSQGFTQDFLAEKLKIEPRQLSKLETGKHYPSFETVTSLLETFKITFEELIDYEHLDSDAEVKQKLFDEVSSLTEGEAKCMYKILRSLKY